MTFTADFTPPTSTITIPSQAVIQTVVTNLSGQASDTAPGLLQTVQLSYYSEFLTSYWNPATGLFNSGSPIYSTATITGEHGASRVQ